MTTPSLASDAPLKHKLLRVPAAALTAAAAPAAAITIGLAAAATRVLGRPTAWFGVLTWGLAFHTLVIAFLFGTLGVPSEVARTLAAWKELAVLGVFVAVVARMFLHKGPHTSVQAVDVVVMGFVALNLAMLAGGDVWFVEQPRPIPMRLYGLRESCFFLLLYAAGRSTPELADDDFVLRRFVALGVTLSVLALFESAFVSADVFAVLGVPLYFQDFLGMEMMSEGTQFGLPQFYFTLVGGHTVQRAGSAFLSSQALAVSFLLIMPAATLRMYGRQRRPSVGQWLVYLLLWAGLFASITRMTTVTCIVIVAVLLVLLRRFDVLALFIGASLAATVVAIVFVPGFAEFVWQTLTWQTLSSASHTRDWVRAYYTIAANPLGAGLGTADLTPLRFGYQTLTGDNLLLKYGVELGLPGMLTFAALLVGILANAWTVSRRAISPAHRDLALLTLATTLGIVINGLTAVLLSLPFLAYLYFWLAGTVVALREQVKAAP
jgi:hypothetical protein